jgi:hypothetical protein
LVSRSASQSHPPPKCQEKLSSGMAGITRRKRLVYTMACFGGKSSTSTSTWHL